MSYATVALTLIYFHIVPNPSQAIVNNRISEKKNFKYTLQPSAENIENGIKQNKQKTSTNISTFLDFSGEMDNLLTKPVRNNLSKANVQRKSSLRPGDKSMDSHSTSA